MPSKIYRPSAFKRYLGWSLVAFAAASAAAMFAMMLVERDTETGDVAAAIVLTMFLALLALCGIVLARTRFELLDGHIDIVGLLWTTRLDVRALGGYGVLVLTVALVPTTVIRLYDPALRERARLIVSRRDNAEVLAWLSARLREIVDDGTPIRSNARYADPRNHLRDGARRDTQ
jgi:hypothetical protein